jgi:hypothetical protein
VSEKDGFVGVLVANLRFNVNNEKCDLVLQLAAFCSLPFFNQPLRTSSTAEHKKTSLADKRRFWRQESHLGSHARKPYLTWPEPAMRPMWRRGTEDTSIPP